MFFNHAQKNVLISNKIKIRNVTNRRVGIAFNFNKGGSLIVYFVKILNYKVILA